MIQRKRKSMSFWAAAVGGIFMLAFFILIGRFVFIAQGKEIDGHNLIQVGKNQWSDYEVVNEKRGTIYSGDGRVLAEDVPAYTLYAVVSSKADSYVKDKVKTASELAPILNMKESAVLAILNKKAYQVEFGSNGKMLSEAKKSQIDRLKLPGIGFTTESERFYPEQSGAAYTIGFTRPSADGSQQTGVLGIEQSLNRYLTEKDGMVRYYRSLGGVPIPDESRQITQASPGNDVHLTLNTQIQTVLDQAMTGVYNTYKPSSMIGIVADPKTGKILALSTLPDFNPNLHNITQFNNIAISSPYEPGSVMKIFTVASAIDSGSFHGTATYKSGSYTTAGGTIHDWNYSGWGMIDFDQAFELSSNVGMSVLTDQYLGPDKLGAYLKKFGFMQKTGIDLPGESSSLVNWGSKIDKLETSFGQSSAFTAMQIVQAATAIADNGTMMRPYVVDKIVNPDTHKTVLANHPTVAGRPISAQAAEQTRALMRQVVSNKNVVNGYGATGTLYDLPGYDVIGKTGTAQIAENGQYLTGKNNYVYSFLGMAPQNDPKVIVYVAVKQPHLKPTDTGEEPVVNVVKPVMSSTLEYMQVQKKTTATVNQQNNSSSILNQFIGSPIDQAVQSLKAKGFDPVAVGTGQVVGQMPYPGEQLIKGSKVILLGSGTGKMPDLTGWSLADSMKLANAAGMKLTAKGDGFVASQKPAPGSIIKAGDTLAVELKPQ
ncbi:MULTISPECIES: penicillin-binding transpeptidase domain-containing protein [unclassified Sporolactobacillus]|uniref:penicillin-binding transpeptidase domain-containing protein n=1 Tax=unclassified Sporolactobacillus TaxID=2628533 RepID=UPI0023678C2A|nr:penicillin-binding transpeptidase domain-containing protein [Sporolactobacillus sp. CQH2019]MDD9147162.1 penicillin-binding transpeptidase domain-containing protein [Sporolactobacillus sp. CQH2019]